MNAIKFTKLNEDNVETLGIQELLLETLKELGFNEFDYTTVEELEYKHRDGFTPHSHNRGGADFLGFTSIGGILGSGYHMGTKIESWVNDQYDETIKQILEENPNLKKETEEFYQVIDDSTYDEYSALAWRIRLMYEGDGTLVVHSGWDKDAPYFRWSCKSDLEQEIKFRTIKGLKTKLKKAIEKAIKNM